MCKEGEVEKVTMEVEIDKCMVPLVKMLNKYGIRTLYCCCGHGNSTRGDFDHGYKNGGYIVISGEHAEVTTRAGGNFKKIKNIDSITIELPSIRKRAT